MKTEIQKFEELYTALDELYVKAENPAIELCLEEMLEKMALVLVAEKTKAQK